MANRWRLYIRALRAFSLPVSTGGVLAATAIALPVDSWRLDVLLASVAAVGFYHMAGNLLNDYFDFITGVDTRNENDEGRPGRLLVGGLLTPREILIEALICLALAMCVSVWLVFICSVWLVVLAIIAALAGYSYTAPLINIKGRGLGEIWVALVFGPLLMLGAAYAQTGNFEIDVFLLSIPAGLAVAAILLANNIRDYEEDKSASVKTLAGIIGLKCAGRLYIAMVCISVAMPALLAVMDLASRWLAMCPLLLVLLTRPLAAHRRNQRLADTDVKTARFVTALLAVYVLAYALG